MLNFKKSGGCRTAALFSAAALALTPTFTAAQDSGGLGDLVGARAVGAENEMESRGWHVVTNHSDRDRTHGYWWNSSRRECVRVTTYDGRYQSISGTSPADCNQSRGSNNGAAAAAVGIAAIIGVAALASRSHHRNDREYDNQNDYADFERGHRDGLYNHSYSNDRRSTSYSEGYQSGINERGEQSRYRPEYQQNGYYQGNSYERDDFSGLVGERAPGVMSNLMRQGFRSVDNFESGRNARGSVWYNGRTRQCLQLITLDGRADSITDIQTHPRCR